MPRFTAVAANRFDGAGVERLAAQAQFLRAARLPVNIRVTIFLLAREIIRRNVAAHVTVNAVRVNVKGSGDVFRLSGVAIRHCLIADCRLQIAD